MFSYSQNYQPPGPEVVLRITDNRRSLQFPPFLVLVDTGADSTVIPASVVESLSGRFDYQYGTVFGYDGQPRQGLFVRILDATVEFLDQQGSVLRRDKIFNLSLPVLPQSQHGFLGRDIMNSQVWEFDGPGLLARIK